MKLSSWRHFDFWLIGAVSVLIIFSIAMINSAIAGNPELIDNNTVFRQAIFGLIGFVVIIAVTIVDYHFWIPISKVLYVILGILLVFILVAGEALFGSARSVDFGFLIIQPSELAKITIILTSADYFSKHHRRLSKFSWVIRSSFLMLFLVGLIILQPDLSTSIVLVVIWLALLFASGLKFEHMVIFLIMGITLPIVTFPFLADYQKARIVNFIAPNEDARFGEEYNVNQASIAVGSGGLLGQGYGQGTQVQLRFLKVRHSDFIFSSIAQEFGFIGTTIIMLLIFFVVIRCVRAAGMAHDLYGALICYGVATWFLFQAFVNIGMNLNLLPVTGLPLPFVSQGGSSLLSLMLGVGLVESVVSRHQL
jgi:rod shape determining protein RodA